MRILLWHGWLLAGSGSNVYTARVAEELRRRGHDVLLLCQEPHPERFAFVDAWGAVGPEGVRLQGERADGARSGGRVVLLRPAIGPLLPVFVRDEYEGFEVRRFVELRDGELGAYLDRNALALRAAHAWHGSEAVIAGHAVPGPAVARRALGAGRYAAKTHGSDVLYAIEPDPRYRDLAREGLEGATAVVGSSRYALERLARHVPAVRDRLVRVVPGVDVERFRPADRREALEAAAARLEADRRAGGRPGSVDAAVADALARRDGDALDALARAYDQDVPDPDAAGRLRSLAAYPGPLLGYLGKLIPAKGVDRFLGALADLPDVRGLVVGFGLFREWLTALVLALDAGDEGALAWLRDAGGMEPGRPAAGRGVRGRVTFTGRLDHRYAAEALAALDVLVVPSVLPEAFGMVAAEAAAAGAIPLLARHSGLAETAEALEAAAGAPGLCSFDPEAGAEGIAAGVRRVLALPPDERRRVRRALAAFVAREWTWARTAGRLLAAALGRHPDASAT